MSETPDHFSQPFQFNTKGYVETVEQNSTADIQDCVFRVLLCEEGFREDLPEFGRPQLEFQTVPLELEAMIEAVERWEPQATPEATEQALEATNQGARQVSVVS